MTRNRRRFAVETLEPRWLLTSGPADIGTMTTPVQTAITTVPTDRAQVYGSLTSFVVTFGMDVRDDWIDWTGYDINLYQVTDGGGLVPVFNVSNYPNVSFDNLGDQATYQLVEPLPPGEYQIVLQAGDLSATLATIGGRQLWDPTQNQTLADFTVAPQGIDKSNSVNLGSIGSNVVTYHTSFNPAGGQNSFDLYKISLPGSSHVRLGVELDAQSIISSFRGAIALFDSSGNILATRDAGSGMPATPDDPYLFAGLSPSVYYIGVSQAGNLPSPTGGYASATGLEGPYTLKVVADPITPTRVVGYTLRWDDALDPSPTGVTLAFSGPIAIDSLLGQHPGSSVPLIAVDGANHSWTLTPSGYQASQWQVSFVFNQRLPAGHYTLQLPPSGGLTDLLGQPPIAPGQPGGVLASFTVAPRLFPAFRGDLGVLWPSLGDQGITRQATLDSGQSAVIRAVVPVATWYTLETNLAQGKLAIRRIDASGLYTIDAGTTASLNQYPMYLKEGVYIFTFTALGTEPVQVRWTLRSSGVDPESLVNNGVGQTAALALRLIDPTSAGLSPASSPTVATVSEYSLPGDSAPFPSPLSASPDGRALTTAASGATPPGLSSLSVSASLLVTVNSGLLGKPSDQDEHGTLTGLLVANSSASLADRSAGVQAGGLYPASGPVGSAGAPLSTLVASLAEEIDSGSATGPAIAVADTSEESASAADASALAKTDRIEDLATMLVRWMIPGSTGKESDQAPAELGPGTLLAAAGAGAEHDRGQPDLSSARRSDRIDRAELGVPTTLLLVSAAAYRMRQLVRRWWRRSGGMSRPCPGPRPRATGQGPHSTPRRVTGTGRVRVSAGD
jgi:hypothetical protein